MKIFIAIAGACIFGTILNSLYIEQIGAYFSSGNQNYYLLDAYYYWHLGSLINTSTSSIASNFELAFNIAPTINSTGVVLVASYFNLSPDAIYGVPIFFSFIYLLLFYNMRCSSKLSHLMIVAILIATAPLPFLVSKESLLCIGILIIARYGKSINNSKQLFGITTGLLLVAIGRFEVLGFLLISYIMTISGRKAKIFLAVAGVIPVTYYFNHFYDYALIAETVAISQDNEFCGVATNTACLTSGASLPAVLLTRFILSIVLPFKWIFALFESFACAEQVSLFWARFSQGLFALIFLRWLYLLAKYKKQKKIEFFHKYSKFGLWFFVTYSAFYMIIIFQQPTRQIQFALSVAMIFVTLGSTERDPKNVPPISV